MPVVTSAASYPRLLSSKCTYALHILSQSNEVLSTCGKDLYIANCSSYISPTLQTVVLISISMYCGSLGFFFLFKGDGAFK